MKKIIIIQESLNGWMVSEYKDTSNLISLRDLVPENSWTFHDWDRLVNFLKEKFKKKFEPIRNEKGKFIRKELA